ncbi:UbiA-like protein EboC [Oculatella sp. LEGE 06141]|uniref:UbiA-like protein EboC n=1 Tax=Oculatella sp. LEGE 06141 TaxID=1828648 RepID=UPI0018803ABF|nr:UbiA-like protein EboC [Oculatella sp. LEGE 06141]MBE9181452.1 UbiA-like protein EboC [Oculatella sp. LEGE 06141]
MNTATLQTNQWWAYLQLMRPANIVTAWADIVAGFAVSGAILGLQNQDVSSVFVVIVPLGWLLLATTGLYGGGVVFNDVFDAELDAIERPERPIPSDRVSRRAATLLGSALLALGILAASQSSGFSAAIASIIAATALLYDAIAKHHPVFGPLTMGLCRGGNLLLGVSIIPAMVSDRWYLALIPILYIAAITAISRGEVEGGHTLTGITALVLMAIVMSSLIVLGSLFNHQLLAVLSFTALLATQIIPPFIKATRNPLPEHIRAAVKAGVLSLIILDAAIAASFAGLFPGLATLLLLPLSIGLARIFSVT